MAYLIGTDEAGYGPNLGPLVITATVWKVPDQIQHEDLYSALESVITSTKEVGTSRIWMADSKQVYKSKGSLAPLEIGVLSAYCAAGCDMIGRWQEIWKTLAAVDNVEFQLLPWYVEYDESLPIDATQEAIDTAATTLKEGLSAAGIELCGIHSSAVLPRPFNESLREYEKKSEILSRQTFQLVFDQIANLSGDIRVLCDQHGGRRKYAGLLQECCDQESVEIRCENETGSCYGWHREETSIEFRFQPQADSILAVALASMSSKFVRELAMRAFNRYWCDQLDDLQPTAGYPVDAGRFKEQISKVQAQLGITDQILWRRK